jgi:hypothetical protein
VEVQPQPPLLHTRWPILATELAAALGSHGEDQLREQVERLRVVEMCSCGDDFCQSFYTAPKPHGPYGDGHRNILLAAPWQGFLILNVVNDDTRYPADTPPS